ncbi:pyruvate kinase [Erythrobacter sp. THAF29]|nr:pyruvate kinase [Erythrobacter sp. THAF29]
MQLDFRLTFSFGTPELQLSRARQIRRAAEAAQKTVAVWGSLSGLTHRIGKIFSAGHETVLQVKKFTPLCVLEADEVDLTKLKALPIPNLSQMQLKEGDRLIYGDHQCEFTVGPVVDGTRFITPTSSQAITGTRSIYLANDRTDASSPIIHLREELRAIQQNGDIFDGAILPDVTSRDFAIELIAASSEGDQSLAIGSSIERALPEQSFVEILEASRFVILDRAKIALNSGMEAMPLIVQSMVNAAEGQADKIFIASHIATTVSQGSRQVLSSAEISDLWHHKKSGVGGVVLTEETAVDAEFFQALRMMSAFLDANADSRSR